MYLYVHMVLSYSHTHGVVSDNNEANDDDGDEDEEMTRREEGLGKACESHCYRKLICVSHMHMCQTVLACECWCVCEFCIKT